ncbi:MAG: hypothetical protein KJO96_03970 [Winogradskyella sp.]|nr:hypothetical protein [Winogradskyella sp.]
MKTYEFFELLNQNKNKSLVFEYAPQQFVAPNYHITEVKHTFIDSVDCGANVDTWSETIIQLWESPEKEEEESYMSSFKALSILNKVGTIKPYNKTAELKFEYSNNTFHTAHLFVNSYSVEDNKLVVRLGIEPTDCKAKDACGIPETLVVTESSGEPCCSPDGNCC